MNKQVLVVLIGGLIFLHSGWIGAEEGFRDGRFFVELHGLQAFKFDGGLINDLESANEKLIIGPYTWQYGTEEQKRISALAFSTMPDPHFDSRGGELLLEWALADWFGLGFSLYHEEFNARDIPLGSLAADSAPVFAQTVGLSNLSKENGIIAIGMANYLQPYVSLIPGGQQTLIQAELLPALLRSDIIGFLQISSFNVHLGFHFVDHSVWDPYFRLKIGGGLEHKFEVTVLRAGAEVGSRIFLSDSFYLVLQAEATEYFFQEAIEAGYAEKDNVRVYSGHFGVGLAF
ncbi:MAG: hypothetical protein KDK39_10410 [Leptospiraceae bacterium]|nr:hypothetical protein [Leptospiraceae bacterium]